ncbi:hypothetical protein L228DRAFT_244996 [Xylona heveae TC161]|uniref:CNH domain-containing protein n=1 Tax=Xylona heveae (strain CBS 132557 / TC161) TaxID=1328760 RepID=A0A161TPI2_XYLHT|nr:hypothetical protein L228DRAFT_244996 [Xylona heveae TC161]KZF24116.1 hypothetical protein L228DRAFT_244996 [Xylona heveae TC161]
MASRDVTTFTRRGKRNFQQEPGSYILRKLFDDVPIAGADDGSRTDITCIELLEGNLYIGTSAGEILHFVLLAGESDSRFSKPNFILASRLQPTFNPLSSSPQGTLGIQQILLLEDVNKACILCNGTLSFYSLPELTPAFGNTKVSNCGWVGGLDLNKSGSSNYARDGVTVMVSIKNRIRLVRISEEPRLVRNIEFSGCLATVRRDNFACVADAHSYSLLDVDHQQKIPLFPISSHDGSSFHQEERLSDGKDSKYGNSEGDSGAGVSTPMGSASSRISRTESPSKWEPKAVPEERGSQEGTTSNKTVAPGSSQASSNLDGSKAQKSNTYDRLAAHGTARSTVALESKESSSRTLEGAHQSTPQANSLRPHILSPTSTEFLLTTGTNPLEPGVGMFVNLDGDVVRGTLEFSRYPEGIALDGRGINPISGVTGDIGDEGYVLAVMGCDSSSGNEAGLEIQRWDVGPGEGGGKREWISMKEHFESSRKQTTPRGPAVGIRRTTGRCNVFLEELREKMQLAPIRINELYTSTENCEVPLLTSAKQRDSLSSDVQPSIYGRTSPHQGHPKFIDQGPTDDLESLRNEEERQFIDRISYIDCQTVLWAGDKAWWVFRNPLAIRLDSLLEKTIPASKSASSTEFVDIEAVAQILNNIRDQEPKTELDFLSLNYVKQKAGLLLLTDMISRVMSGVEVGDDYRKMTEEALVEGNVDPRIVLSLIPGLREHIVQGERGIWAFSGVKEIIIEFLADLKSADVLILSKVTSDFKLLHLLKQYLSIWRKKKGFGSVTDENEISQTVDSGLLHVLLILDQQSPKGPATPLSLRADLNNFVDQGVECIQSAAALIERYHRLYVLSRLYQSRKMAGEVLQTWRRILEGEPDYGGEFIGGYYEMRKYLLRIRDSSLVKEYALWLARRDAQLGVSVFTDSTSRVKFEAVQVIDALKSGAPNAMIDYLEYLVFVDHDTMYANDLILYYTDTIIGILNSSDTMRSVVVESYEAYKALHYPRPTYRQFIEENFIQEEWCRNRLRLLQLLGGTEGLIIDYDVSTVMAKIEPLKQVLVPEMIILDCRQGRHQQALRLLTHTLGDYDSAVHYCLVGGSSMFRRRPLDATASQFSQQEQSALFSYLLTEMLQIQDITERIERTGELLDRFGKWFDVHLVLTMIPESWSIDILSGFLVSALQQLVTERNETLVTKALSAAENLRAAAEYIANCKVAGPIVEEAS